MAPTDGNRQPNRTNHHTAQLHVAFVGFIGTVITTRNRPSRPARDNEMLTTRQAAELLGTTRRHIVELCRTGTLPHTASGAYQRIRRSDVEALRQHNDELRLEDRHNLRVAHTTAGQITADPHTALEHARHQITRMRTNARGQATTWLDQWARLIDGPLETLLAALTDPSPQGRELRRNSPFTNLAAANLGTATAKRERAGRHTEPGTT